MKIPWILSIFPILLSVGLVMVILGQYEEMELVNKRNADLQRSSKATYDKFQYEATYKKSLKDLLVKGEKAVKDLEDTLASLAPQLESKTKESDTCQEQLKSQTKAVGSTEEAQKKTTDSLNIESEAWTKEIDTLKANLVEYSPICAYVKDDKKALELCGKENSTTPREDQKMKQLL